MKNDNTLLLSIKYNPLKILWRLFIPNGLVVLVSIYMIFRVLESDYDILKYLLGFSFFSFMLISSIALTIEMLLFKEIRFYKKHFEKEWHLFGIKKIEYINTKIRGISTFLFSNKNFLYLKKNSFFKYKCCGYDEQLLNKNDVKKANEVLSKISSRDIKDFTSTYIEMPLLITTGDIK